MNYQKRLTKTCSKKYFEFSEQSKFSCKVSKILTRTLSLIPRILSNWLDFNTFSLLYEHILNKGAAGRGGLLWPHQAAPLRPNSRSNKLWWEFSLSVNHTRPKWLAKSFDFKNFGVDPLGLHCATVSPNQAFAAKGVLTSFVNVGSVAWGPSLL